MSNRQLKINEILRQNLSQILTTDLEIPADIFITLTTVDCASDLKTARVQLSVLPFAKAPEALKLILRQQPLIQKQLREAWQFKWVPRLTFSIDPTEERVQEINSIIDQL